MYSFHLPDYLAIRTDPEVLGLSFDSEAQVDYHRILERKTARFFGAPASVFFPDGYMAYLALLRSLVREGDSILVATRERGIIKDALEIAHRRTRNVSIRALNGKPIAENIRPNCSRVLVLARGLAETECGISPVARWVEELRNLHDQRGIPGGVLLEDSHAVGILGPQYRGVLEHLGVDVSLDPESSAPVQCCFSASFSKAFGAYGGFIVGARPWIRQIRETEPGCSDRHMPISMAVATLKSLQLTLEPERHARLARNILLLHQILAKYELPFESHPLLPYVLIKTRNPRNIVQSLIALGFRIGLTHFTRSPKLRINVNAAHTEREIELLAQKLASLLKKN
ncbi:MAG: aminotransferase class I/II-fold pyridoxal phosphate-dependent enzyme [Planctomycetia bacterium]|nr:aminotransferase class I/II-fold pyridoxal phosphate-dependent enzyme [Planctomycetia bacterium]